ncbi:hypothetical protein GQ44DRAFT_742608 [Phaeosphaeriaceae sp. PMI808]|nr:hypothetical protein GQ44DRAFT_742608 [Phaeosphaeriaceae sp. PMI808]
MHASAIVALALGATAVSAAALSARDTCDPFCQFPASIDCPVRGGVHVTKAELTEAVRNARREGAPRETDANNLATRHCSDNKFRGIPLWVTDIPPSAGAVFYALAPNGTFYFCSTTSGTSNGWPSTCRENSTP